MNKLEIVALSLAGILVVVIVIMCLIKQKERYTHLPGLITFPENKKLPPRALGIEPPLGNPKTNDGLERYSLDTLKKPGNPATFSRAYLDPPNLLELPPNKRLVPASKQQLHPISGIPESVYQGSDYMYSQYTPDYLTCKAGVI
jgi:hypothetical protein